MRKNVKKAIAAACMIATIAASFSLASCEGRKMSNMQPTGDTVEVVVDNHQTESDSIPNS